MAITKTHALHKRRGRRNMLVGVVLGGFVAMVFGITISKLSDGQMMEGFDHSRRQSLESVSE